MVRTIQDIFGHKTDAASRALREASWQRNLLKFGVDVFGYNFADFHREQVDVVVNTKNRYADLILPVGHGKTTLWSQVYPMWLFWKYANGMYPLPHTKPLEMCLTSSSETQSTLIMDDLRTQIQNNDYLKEYFPPIQQFGSKQKIRTKDDALYYIRPYNSSARGIQLDLLILDDILRDTDTPMQSIIDMFWDVFFTRVQRKKGKIIVVGTPLTTSDLLAELSEKDGWVCIRKPAVIMDDEGNWLRPLWPSAFTLDELKKIRNNMGSWKFNREYLVDPLAAGGSFFPLDFILSCCDDNLPFTYSSKGITFIGADFAMSDSPTGDYSVFTVVEILKRYVKTIKNEAGNETEMNVDSPIVIKKIERYKGMEPSAQVARLEQLYKQYNAAKIVVDSSTFGRRFLQDLQAKFLPVEGCSFSADIRLDLLTNLRKIIEEGRLVIPYSEDNVDFPLVKIFLRELNEMCQCKTPTGRDTVESKGAHDDTVFSLSLAVKNAFTQVPIDGCVIVSGSRQMAGETENYKYDLEVNNNNEKETKEHSFGRISGIMEKHLQRNPAKEVH